MNQINTIVEPCGPLSCWYTQASKHLPHQGVCHKIQLWSYHWMSGEWVDIPCFNSKSEVKSWLCEQNDIPQLLLSLHWDLENMVCTIVKDAGGFRGSVLAGDEWLLGQTTCGGCGDDSPVDGYECIECGLNECCRRCRKPYTADATSMPGHCYICSPEDSPYRSARSKFLDEAWKLLDQEPRS